MAGIGPLITAMGFLMLGAGLQGTLIGVRTQIEAFSGTLTGIVVAAYYVGFLAGSFAVPLYVLRVGHIRVFAALASTASVAALLYSVAVHPIAWIAIRTLTGLCFAGLYVVAESWVNTRATNTTRGRYMAVYMVTVLGAVGIGQLLLNVADPAGFELFLLSSALVSLAVVPVALARSPQPEFELERLTGVVELTRRSPLGVVTALLTGASNAAVFGMGAVYATRAGLSTGEVTIFMAVSLLGGLALQWPLGHLSDLLPRRSVILAVAVTATVVGYLAVGIDPDSHTMIVMAFIYGGMSFPMYSLAMSYIHDTTPGDSFVGSAAAFMLVSGIGSIAGPLIVSGAMGVFDDEGYWWSLAAMFTPVAVLALYRMITRARVRYRPYVPVAYRSSPVIGYLIEDYGEDYDEEVELGE